MSLEELQGLQNVMLSNDFAWHINVVNSDTEKDQNDYRNFQFTHGFHNGFKPTSDWFGILDPFISRINFKALIRIKANLLTRTHEKIIHRMHSDVEFPCTTGIFYVNSNNGETIFENGERIKSEANTYISFPSQLKHTGTTNTCDSSYRIVINFNYY